MPITNYGVWKGTPLSYEVDGPSDRTPHINLVFGDSENDNLKAAINVKSQASPSELVYWFNRTFSSPLTNALESLASGFQSISYGDDSTSSLALDYIRTPNLLNFQDGRLLPFNESGPNNDILDQLKPILDDAISQKADIYLYGSSFGDGIHDVHMNQGSPGKQFKKDNGVGTDGGFLLRFPDGHWEAVFLAFASQQIPTDEDGNPTPDSKALADTVGVQGDS